MSARLGQCPDKRCDTDEIWARFAVVMFSISLRSKNGNPAGGPETLATGECYRIAGEQRMADDRGLWCAAQGQAEPRDLQWPSANRNPIAMLPAFFKASKFPQETTLRLLVVEDDGQLGPWLQSELASVLGGADLVATLDEALAAISVRQFDLIVVDRRLPDGDGVELLARLRQLQPRPGVLVLTALDDPNDIARALDAGALTTIWPSLSS
jgi:CheY-like chemotaxis protein